MIGVEGAAALSKALKSNATLTSLELVARALLCAGGPVSPLASLTDAKAVVLKELKSERNSDKLENALSLLTSLV
jgi:hypothetical protein